LEGLSNIGNERLRYRLVEAELAAKGRLDRNGGQPRTPSNFLGRDLRERLSAKEVNGGVDEE
jgi:hypothetical protein